jgi:peptidoglycan hydrolase-like protein with peptidoglycan-binding domain
MIYKKGSKGEAVEKIQRFLGIDDDGDFGAETEKAVKKFQEDYKLKPVDGIVGPMTWKTMFGEETMPSVIYQSQLTNLFGTPRDPAPYLKVFSLAEFKDKFGKVKNYEGNIWSFKIYGHELMEKPLKQAFQNLLDRIDPKTKKPYANELKTYDGCTNIRPMSSGGSYSVHSWGLAVDFNATWNRYGGDVNLSDGFIKCFTDAGFTAGAYWNTPDGMHFQLPKI